METIKLKSITNGLRHQKNIRKNLLSVNNKLIKSLLINKKRCAGRSPLTGHITIAHKRVGAKKLYRLQEKVNNNIKNEKEYNIIISVEHNPYQKNFSCLTFNLKTHKFSYKPAIFNTFAGSIVESTNFRSRIWLGSQTQLQFMPIGSIISNISLPKGNKRTYARAPGTYAQLISLNPQKKIARIKLPSNKMIYIPMNSFGIVGRNGNKVSKSTIIGKAGRNFHLGIRPTVRGIAMNPVDHPHGGRTNGGRPSVTPWGLPTKGKFKLKKRKNK